MSSRRFAEGTSVWTDRSRAEIDQLLIRYGATRFFYGMNVDSAMVAFEMNGRRIKFILPMPERAAPEFNEVRVNQFQITAKRATPQQAADKYEQATRQRWRALVLCIKAKLESVESKIETFEEAFLPHIVMQNGRTIGEALLPDLAKLIDTAKMPPLLEAPKNG